MKDLNNVIRDLIGLKEQGKQPITLLAVCPNSSAVLEAAVKAAARNRSVMLFAATLNQVDIESSYTGWTQFDFVNLMQEYADKYHWSGPLYPCLDHGGPWLKDLHFLAHLSYIETMNKVKDSICACIKAGYKLLHIDPTVDRSLSKGQPLPIELVVDRTVELITHSERCRLSLGFSKIAYEVGTEEVHGGLVDFEQFEYFLGLLQEKLKKKDLFYCWPCFFVAQIGTNLHTTVFNPEAAQRLYSILSPLGSMAKGHYTDWIENPEEYPISGVGGANVGPEFTAVEYEALKELEEEERISIQQWPGTSSNFINTLQTAVVESGRWKKWLMQDEEGLPFDKLPANRKEWLLKSGSRYIWKNEKVIAARERLYRILNQREINPHDFVVEKITLRIENYIKAFNLQNSIDTLDT